jgi:hypothetical protein
MTAGLRRGPRRCQQNHLSHRLAAIRRYGAAHLGAVKADLLGENRFREVVALALFLEGMTSEGFPEPEMAREKSLHNISYQTLRFLA